MSRLLLIRHGETAWNVEHRWQGWIDVALNENGEMQAVERARSLGHEGFAPRAIFTSDLQRASRTADIIAAHVEAPVIPSAGFRERFGGEWQGCTHAEIDERWPGMRAAWRRGEVKAPPGGETDETVLARFDDALRDVLAHVGGGVAGIVTHHGLARLVATRAGVNVHQLIPNLGGFWFDVIHGRLENPETLV
jgi:broad specificity phosphatase PhoE